MVQYIDIDRKKEELSDFCKLCKEADFLMKNKRFDKKKHIVDKTNDQTELYIV